MSEDVVSTLQQDIRTLANFLIDHPRLIDGPTHLTRPHGPMATWWSPKRGCSSRRLLVITCKNYHLEQYELVQNGWIAGLDTIQY